MGEIHTFYSMLYDKPLSEEDRSSLNSFLAGFNTKRRTTGCTGGKNYRERSEYYEASEIIPEK